MQFSLSGIKPVFAFAGIMFGLASLAASADTVTETFNVAPGGTLDLKTDVGSLKINTHNADTVELSVRTRGDDAEDFVVTHEVNGADLEIRGELEDGHRGWHRDLRVEFALTVPTDYNLQLETAGGSISIDDLQGNVDANTSGGSINVGNIRGDVDLHTSGGSINTEDIHGQLDAHTSGGSINVTIAEQITEDAELNTSGGSITAYLVSDVRVDLDASTSGGRVRSDFDVDGRVKKRSIRGEINGGGPNLKLHTSGGSISIKSL